MKKLISLIISIFLLSSLSTSSAYAMDTSDWSAYNNLSRGYSFLYPKEFLISYEDESRVKFVLDEWSFTFYDYRSETNKDLAQFIEELWGYDYEKLPHPVSIMPSASIDYMGERNTVMGGVNLLFNFVSPNYSDPDFKEIYDEIVNSFIIAKPETEEGAETEPASDNKMGGAMASFPDLASNHWAVPFVSKLKKKNILKGYENGNFGPNDPVTDEQIIKIVLLSGEHGVSLGEGNMWYVPLINYMKSLLASNYSEGLIEVGSPSSRAEVIAYTLIAKGISLPSGSASGDVFEDVNKNTPFAAYIEEAKKMGIVSGYEGGKKFGPLNNVTRAEVSKIVTNSFFADEL